MGFKKSRKPNAKKYSRRRGQRGRGIGSFFKKAKCLTKKAINLDIGKFAISQGLAMPQVLRKLRIKRYENS